jgi:signal transduction histidine kinase
MNKGQLQQLAAAMAHEVRNPLNSMAIHVELLEGRLKRGELDREGALKSLEVLAGEIGRIDRILDEYLQYAGPEEAARRPIDPPALIAEVVQRARPRAEARGVGLEVHLGLALGRWAVDGEGVGQALEALIDNAVEASERGQVVDITARADEDQAELEVTDRGEGLSAEDLVRVFHLGFSRRGRPGIGLTVAKQIVKGHGGSIGAQSRGRGAGATFTIRIPLETP